MATTTIDTTRTGCPATYTEGVTVPCEELAGHDGPHYNDGQEWWSGPERRASARLPRDSRATVTAWDSYGDRCRSCDGSGTYEEGDYTCSTCEGHGLVTERRFGITDGTQTIEYPTLHAARMAAYIHNLHTEG